MFFSGKKEGALKFLSWQMLFSAIYPKNFVLLTLEESAILSLKSISIG